jgi:iron complex outermembrane receptor protein
LFEQCILRAERDEQRGIATMRLDLVNLQALTVLILCLVGLSAPAAAVAADVNTLTLEEIIVTAQRRSQDIQDVPISMVAISEQALERKGLDTFEQALAQIPNVAFSGERVGTSIPAIRGISGNGTGGLAVVTVYLDETPLTAVNEAFGTASPVLFDMNRVEVLRGPQGTLYGASSLGGTIRLITQQPNPLNFESKLRADLGYTDGGGPNENLDGMVNIPIVANVFAIRTVASLRNSDGYIDRPSLTPPFTSTTISNPLAAEPRDETHHINRDHSEALRLSGRWNVSDTFILTPTFSYQKATQENPNLIDPSQPNLTAPAGVDIPQHDTFYYYNLRGDSQLPFGDLTASITYLNRQRSQSADFGALFAGAFGYTATRPLFGFNIENNDYTAEVRLASKAVVERGLEWTAGVFYFDTSLRNQGGIIVPGFRAITGLPFPPNDVFFLKDDTRKRRDLGEFGEATWRFDSHFYATGGVRFSTDHQNVLGHGDGFFNGGPSSQVTPSDAHDVSPRFLLGFKPRESSLLYASVTQGFRPGGGQRPPPAAVCGAELAALGISTPTQFTSDKITSYELGEKSEWHDHRILLNAAVFDMDWKNIQVPFDLACGFSITANAGLASSRGAEIETSLRVTEALSIGVSLGYTSAKLERSVPALSATSGERLLNVPRETGAAEGEYRFPIGLGSARHGFLRADLSYTGNMYTGFQQTPQNLRPSLFLAGARIGIAAEHWEGSLYVDNALNRRTAYFIDMGPGPTQWAVNRPRTVGMTFAGRF